MNQEEKIFASGFSFKRNEKAPDFVVGSLSLKAEDAIEFIKSKQKSGWLNLSVKRAKSGSYYVELDTFDPKKQSNMSGSNSQSTPYNSAPNKNSIPNNFKSDLEDDGLPF